MKRLDQNGTAALKMKRLDRNETAVIKMKRLDRNETAAIKMKRLDRNETAALKMKRLDRNETAAIKMKRLDRNETAGFNYHIGISLETRSSGEKPFVERRPFNRARFKHTKPILKQNVMYSYQAFSFTIPFLKVFLYFIFLFLESKTNRQANKQTNRLF